MLLLGSDEQKSCTTGLGKRLCHIETSKMPITLNPYCTLIEPFFGTLMIPFQEPLTSNVPPKKSLLRLLPPPKSWVGAATTGESPDPAIEAYMPIDRTITSFCVLLKAPHGEYLLRFESLVSSLKAASPNTGATCPCNHFGNHDPSPLHLPSPFSGFSVSCARQHLESKDPQPSDPDSPTYRKFFEATAHNYSSKLSIRDLNCPAKLQAYCEMSRHRGPTKSP